LVAFFSAASARRAHPARGDPRVPFFHRAGPYRRR